MEARTVIGAITIGQSPRTDITADLLPMLSPSIELREYGALDPYTLEECRERFAPKEGSPVLVSRMRDGSQVEMAEEAVIPLVQDCILRAEAEGAEGTVLFCTGQFPAFRHQKFLLVPQPVIHSMVKAMAGDSLIGVLIPDQAQVPQVEELFSSNGVSVTVTPASPYREAGHIKAAAGILSQQAPAFLYMDCMGYGVSMKEDARLASGLPVVLPRTMIARIINELFG